jgi:transglutaminase-like putative cysteine protease
MQIPFADGGGPAYRSVDETRIVHMVAAAGWAHEIRLGDAARATGEARAALQHYVELGLQFATATDGRRLFDPAEVINFVIWAGLTLADPLWPAHFVATARRLALDMHPQAAHAAGPPPVATLPPARFSMTIAREFNLRFSPPGQRARLRLPLPLDDSAVENLRIAIIPPANQRDVRYSRSAGRLDAVLHEPAGDQPCLGVHASFVARPLPMRGQIGTLTAAERELYTRHAEGIIQVTPRVAELAAGLAGAATDVETLIDRLWRFVIDHVLVGTIRYDQVPATRPLDWVLDQRWCDCQLGAALLVGLCRARGIPARLCSGYVPYPVIACIHFWLEIWTPSRGWLPFDMLAWGTSMGGRDIAWRDYFRGGIGYRVQTQRLPRLFTGLSPVRLPPAWHILTRCLPDGAEIGVYANATGEAVFIDRISVHEPSTIDRYASVNAGPLLPSTTTPPSPNNAS